MAYVNFENVAVDFPIYNVAARSLKKRLMRVATGGQLDEANGQVVVRALDGLTFKLEQGDRVGVVGHNGAGKSTLLRVLSGVYEPSVGTASVDGRIGSLIDISLGIDTEATGRENIYIRGALLGFDKAEIDDSMEELIEFSELGDFIDLPLRTYSTGMHLRLAFAVSTMVKPEILIMDEWLSVGDGNFNHKAENRLAKVVEASSILVLASHSQDLIKRTCNRALWLEHGKVRMDSSVDDVCNAYFV